MSEPASKVRPWDTSLPDYFALDLYENGTIDAAISVTAAQTANGLGLAHEVVSAARHLELFNVPAAPLDVPPDFAGTAAQMKNQQRAHDWHAAQEKNRPFLRSGFVGGIPERIIRLAEMNGSLRHHAHVHDIIADLRAKLPLTHRDLDICIEGVRRSYPRGALIRPFVADQLRFLGYLTSAGHGLSNRDAVNLLRASFTSNKVDKADFGPALAEYLKDHGGIVAQTPANWCAFIIKFVEDRLDHHAEANAAARRGNANAVVAEEAHSPEPSDDPTAARAHSVLAQNNKLKEQPRRSKRKASEVSGKAPGNSAPRKLPSGPKQPGDPLYCWTHGRGHASGGEINPCNNPAEGHVYSADFRNQQNGKPAY